MPKEMTDARNHVEQLKSTYRRLRHTQQPSGTWDWWIRNEIEEIEADLQLATKKLTAMPGSQFWFMKIFSYCNYTFPRLSKQVLFLFNRTSLWRR